MKPKTTDPGSPIRWLKRTLTILLCTFMVVMTPLEILLPGQLSDSINNFVTVSAANTADAKTGPFVIVLDPGHDSEHRRGKNRTSGLVEETYNYNIAKSLKTQLESYGFTVYLTRGESCPVSGKDNMACLEYRALYAKSLGCDLYISLHLNAAGANDGTWRSASGSAIYVSNYSKFTKTTKSLAAYVSKSLRASLSFSQRTPNGMIDTNDNGYTYPDGNKVDSLKVIRLSSLLGFPSILIEHGFMDNKKDSATLKEKGAASVAKADCSAIVSWYKNTYSGLPASGTAAYVNNDILNLRSKASKSSEKLVTLSQYDSLTIYGSSGSWYQVKAKHNGKTYKGYVYSSYVKKGAIPLSKISNPDKNKEYDEKAEGSSSGKTGNSGSTGTKGSGTRGNGTASKGNTGSQDGTNGTGTTSKENSGTKTGTSETGTSSTGSTGTKTDGTKKSSSQSTTDGFVRYSFLNLREKASAKSKLIMKLDQYDALKLGKKTDGWYQVTATHKGKTYTGFVSAEYVATGKTGCLGYVNYTYLNVRAGAGTGNKQTDKLYKNDTVMIMDQSNGWYQIKYVKNDKVLTGYVKASYITKKQG